MNDPETINNNDNINNNNNNNKSCNTHVSTLLGVQGTVNTKNKQTSETRGLSKQSEQLTESTKIITFKKLGTKQNSFDTITNTYLTSELIFRLKEGLINVVILDFYAIH